MGETIVEQVLGRSSGNFVEVKVDLLAGHDGTASLVVDRFYKEGFQVWNAEQVLIVFDHFAPPATVERANIQNKLLQFVAERNLPFKLYKGIMHQILLE